MANQLTVIAKFHAKPGYEQSVKQGLLGMVAPSRQDEGVLNYDIFQSTDDPTIFFTYENWTGKDALDKHMQTPHFKNLGEATKDTLAEPMEISLLSMISDPG